MNLGVIITVYNKVDYLARALDSILSQTCPPDQLVIVDDCSSDGSVEIIHQKLPLLNNLIKEVIFIPHSMNKGASGARNSALQIITSDFVIFLDADDYYSPNYIQSLSILLSKDVGMIVSPVSMESSNIIYPSYRVNKYLKQDNARFIILDYFDFLGDESLFIGGGNVCFNRRVFNNIYFDPKEKNFEEWEFYYKILRQLSSLDMKLLYNKSSLYYYNDLDMNSLSRRKVLNLSSVKIPNLVYLLADDSHDKYHAFIISIWLNSTISRLPNLSLKFRFIFHFKKLVLSSAINRYLLSALLDVILSPKLKSNLTDIVKKIYYHR